MTYIGSARIDENGNITGGKAGDQTGKEVMIEPFYIHKLGWYILRPKSIKHASAIASKMVTACKNDNIGYNQSSRNGVVKYGTGTTTKLNSDCSSLVRECVKEGTGTDPGNFNTTTEVDALLETGLFTKSTFKSEASTPLYVGDVLVTKSKGHTVVVTSGNTRSTTVSYFPKYTGSSTGIDEIFKTIGASKYYDTNYSNYKKRIPIAKANGISGYTGSSKQNITLRNLARQGKLVKP